MWKKGLLKMRIVIRGISQENVESWKDKFKAYQIQDIYYNPDKSLFFATTLNHAFISTFNGIKWKGDELLVQESLFPPYIPPSLSTCTKLDAEPIYPPQSLNDSPQSGNHDIALPTDNTITKGWALGKFNRKIAIFKTRDPKTRRVRIINPETFKNNYFRFPDSQDRFRSVVNISRPEVSLDGISDDDSEDEMVHDEAGLSSEKEVKVIINASSLRDLVFPERDTKETGNLFSFMQDDVSTEHMEEDVQQDLQEKVIKSLSNSRLFFMHLDKGRDGDILFQRASDWNEREWEEKRGEYTILFKKRHKDATRRRNRYSSFK